MRRSFVGLGVVLLAMPLGCDVAPPSAEVDCNVGQCSIDGACYDDGSANDEHGCLACDVASDPGDWTPRAGQTCDDGLFCNGTDACDATGSCVPSNVDPCAENEDVCSQGCNEELDQCRATKGTKCRSAAGACDVAEFCTGDSGRCPVDAFVAEGTVCREDSGDCDIAESCSGDAGACPADAFVGAETVCRDADGDCDVAESCTGDAGACPVDAFVLAGTVCREAIVDCDVAEWCTGNAGACPVDEFAAEGTVCREGIGDCDVAETCTGNSVVCPVDQLVAAGTVCREDSGDCDIAESCSGDVGTCPVDGFVEAGTVCRDYDGDCDVKEYCSGHTGSCPADRLVVGGVVCRDAKGDCDVAERCTGQAGHCPVDELADVGTVCREGIGDCDLAETCTGDSVVCPVDQLVAEGTVCREGDGVCDPEETCSGVDRACPADQHASDDVPCDDHSGHTLDDFCNGAGSCEGTEFCELATCQDVVPTGYTLSQCWDVSSEVPCSDLGGGLDGELDYSLGCSVDYLDYCGQDGQYPDKVAGGDRFTIEGEEVTDHLTGLIWQNDVATDKRWSDAMTHCADPWRLPSTEELVSLVEYGRNAPAVAPEFVALTSDNNGHFWSSMPAAHNGGLVWYVSLVRGDVFYLPAMMPTAIRSVRCVQGGPSAETGTLPRFVVVDSSGDNVLADRVTGLDWQAPAIDGILERNWRGALEECEQLSYANHDDWRLPNISELHSLVDYTQGADGPAVHPDIAALFPESPFVSSSPSSGDRYQAWHVDYATGQVDEDSKDTAYSVRCVRDGL